MKQPPRLGLVVAWGVVLSLLFNAVFYAWFRTNSLATFKVSEFVHTINWVINDNLPFNFMVRHDRALQSDLDQIVDTTDLSVLLSYAFVKWDYKDDLRYWDVADLPVVAFAHLSGDCDDYARMAAYVEHKKGFDSYFVSMVSADSGHAASVYYDPSKKLVILADINGVCTRAVESFDMKRDIGQLIRFSDPDMVNFGVRSWDLKTILLYARVPTKE